MQADGKPETQPQLIADLLHVETLPSAQTVVKCVFQGSDSSFVKCGNAAADRA